MTPYNHKLAWKCRELKPAGKTHSTWSSGGVIKLRHTMNKHLIFIVDETEASNLYLDFVFQERQKQAGKHIPYFSLFCVSFHLGVHASYVCVVCELTSWLICSRVNWLVGAWDVGSGGVVRPRWGVGCE